MTNTNTNELIQLANFLKTYRRAIVKRKGTRFINKDMYVLNRKYYIQIMEEKIEIRTEENTLKLSNDSSCSLNSYYDFLKTVFYDVYENKIGRRKCAKKIDFILQCIAKDYSNIIKSLEESLDYESLKECI